MLGRELDLEDSTLTHINHDIRGLKDKAFKVLMTWYERAPEATTKDKLVDALRELRRKDIADDIADMEWRHSRVSARLAAINVGWWTAECISNNVWRIVFELWLKFE